MLHALHVIEVLVRPEHKGVGARKESYGLGESIVVTVPRMIMGRFLFAGDLLLEKRASKRSPRHPRMELLNGIEIVAQR